MTNSFEVHIGIIAACIPTLRPGYKWLLQRLSTSGKISSMHIPLADSPQDEIRRDPKTSFPLSVPGVKDERAGVPDGEILKTTTVDVERGSAGW